MTNIKHTPEPWKIYDMCLPSRKCIEIRSNSGETIAILPQPKKRVKYYVLRDIPGLEANAHLIVSAPKLLKALIRLRNELKEDDPSMWEHIESSVQVEQVIAEAILK